MFSNRLPEAHSRHDIVCWTGGLRGLSLAAGKIHNYILFFGSIFVDKYEEIQIQLLQEDKKNMLLVTLMLMWTVTNFISVEIES